MLKTRLIPVLLLQNGMLVRSEIFSTHQIIGNPIFEVERFNQWNVDELIYLDISAEGGYDLRRDDAKIRGLNDPLTILEAVSKSCFMPLTWGGRIRSVEDMRARFSRGADKISINSEAVRRPELVEEAARVFGNQAIVVSIDARKNERGEYEVWIDGGKTRTEWLVENWVKEAERRGAGEILLQSIDQDGCGNGYDTEYIRRVTSFTTIPVIACSGVGRFEDYFAGIEAGASAVAAANIWHFKEFSDKRGKQALAKQGVDVRL